MMDPIRKAIDSRFTSIVIVGLLSVLSTAYVYGYRRGRAAATEDTEDTGRVQRSKPEGDQDLTPDQIESDVTAEDLLEGVR